MINWLKKSAFAKAMADKKENFVPIIIFILAALPFIFNFRDFFVSDDWDFLTQVANPHQPLWQYFLTNYVGTHAGGSYRPLVVWFWAFCHHLWQLNYFWYHLVQIFLHAANVVLLYLIVLNFVWPNKKEDRFAWAVVAAAIFAILPNHSEAVAWLAAIGDPLCSFFFLASLLPLLFCLKYPRAKYWLYAGSLVFFSAALFTKEMAISLPFIVLIFAGYYQASERNNAAPRGDYFRASADKIIYFWKNRASVKMIKILFVVPYFIILAGYLWLRYRAIGLFFGYYGAEHLHLGLMKTAAVYGDIITSFVLSDNWRTIFSLWLNNNLVIVLAAGILLFVGLLYLTWKKKWPVWPWLVFLSLLASLAPVASFGINLTKTYFSEEGERYGYLPSLFFAIILAAGIIALWKKNNNKLYSRIIFSIIIILIAGGLAGQLLVKNWRYQQAAIVAQKSLSGAVALMRQGDYIGVLFFGLPDNFHGAPIFRNGWQQAIAFYLPQPPIILSPFNRTADETGQKFAVEKIDQNNFNYYSVKAAKSILAKPNFSSADYSTVLRDYIFEPAGINDRYFGDSLLITLSKDLAANPQVALFFWDGEKWVVLIGQR
ncbi:MAG: hypothetical protein PHE24_03655 [Patescibacteria group bacterium]|nr:hypothetical protein [Patescibacteria group bacterium]